MGTSFLHGPLLVFHEAGHVLFRLFGEWMMFLGGTLGQLLMPAIIVVAFLWKNRDPFGAAVGLWLLGASLLDVAPYMFDALDPQLMLLSGNTGEAGGHDWIYLFNSLGLLPRAPLISALTQKLGARCCCWRWPGPPGCWCSSAGASVPARCCTSSDQAGVWPAVLPAVQRLSFSRAPFCAGSIAASWPGRLAHSSMT